MKPKLKDDTFFMQTDDGVYVYNNQGSLRIKGKSAYRWIEVLAPYLTGEHSLEDLIQGIDQEKRSIVIHLLETLLDKQYLKDVSLDRGHSLNSAEMKTYATEIAFIDSLCDSAAYRFEQFRLCQILVIGGGQLLQAFIHSALNCGVRQLTVLLTQEGQAHYGHTEFLKNLRMRDPEQKLREIRAPDWDNEAEVQAILQPYNMIIHISDVPMLARAKMLNHICFAQQKFLLQALVVADSAWIGPALQHREKKCWECAWRRLQGNLQPMHERFPIYAFSDNRGIPASSFLRSSTTALVSNLLSFEMLKYVTGAGSVETIGHLIEIDLKTLTWLKHSFSSHPLCDTCQQPDIGSKDLFMETIQQLAQGDVLDPDLFSQRAASCFEKRCGIFSVLNEDDLAQLPLSLCHAVVSNPMPENLADPLTVLGIGASFGKARRNATQRACEVYASSVVDQRRLLAPIDIDQTRIYYPVISANYFVTDGKITDPASLTWAYNLNSGQPGLVPASLAFPILRNLSPLTDASSGISSGWSWDEAICNALLRLGEQMTIKNLEDVQKPYSLVDLEHTPLEPEGTRQRHLLNALERAVTVYDVTGTLQIPTFAFCLDNDIVAYSSHLDVSTALLNGFEQTMKQYQMQLFSAPETTTGIFTVPNLSPALRGSNKTMSDYVRPDDWSARRIWLQHTFYKNGMNVFVVPLDSDPALHAVLPYIVHVLLAHILPEDR